MRQTQVQDPQQRQQRIVALAREIMREMRALGLPHDRSAIEFGDGVLLITRLSHVPGSAAVLLMRDLARRGERARIEQSEDGVILYASDADAAREAAATLLYGEASDT